MVEFPTSTTLILTGPDSTAHYGLLGGLLGNPGTGLPQPNQSHALEKSPFAELPSPLNRSSQSLRLDAADILDVAQPHARKPVGQRSSPLSADSFSPDRDPLLPSEETDAAKPRRRSGAASDKDAEKDPLTGVKQSNALVAVDGQKTGPLGPATRQRAVGLPYPGRVLKYVPGAPLKFDTAAKQWQERMQERGWSIQVDGFYGPQSDKICRQFQREKGLQVDGMVGPATWAAAFRADNVTTPNPGGSSELGRINQKGLELVKKFEGLVLKAYRDPVGIWTIGYGHTGPEVGPGDVITKAEAEALLKKDLMRFEKAVRNLVKVPLNSNQFSALVSFTFNVGSGAFAQSTMLSLLNQRDYQGAANQFSRWVYGGGQVLPGLVRRRNEERALFLTRV
ncbi:glycoside hydrolase family protein [Leptolyngbya sp. NK1-12]|uniref:glycoside hydrolase family protein n=1 Tax=Leptolyngbya sp. NK1-12 TaxID=2547451 RepID=UPI002930CE05